MCRLCSDHWSWVNHTPHMWSPLFSSCVNALDQNKDQQKPYCPVTNCSDLLYTSAHRKAFHLKAWNKHLPTSLVPQPCDQFCNLVSELELFTNHSVCKQCHSIFLFSLTGFFHFQNRELCWLSPVCEPRACQEPPWVPFWASVCSFPLLVQT